MKFDHMVKYNGVIYATGENVPIQSEIPEENKSSVEEIVETEEGLEISPSSHLYTRSELEEMTVKEMRQIAEEKCIELPTGVNKAEIINAFLNAQ